MPHLLALVGLFGPALAAGIVMGRTGREELTRRLRTWRVPARWYVLAALLMPTVYAAALLLHQRFAGERLDRLWLGSSPAFLIASLAWLVIVTSGEEIGWRGFALPELLRLGLSPLGASLALGLVWGVWHLPFYWPAAQTGIPYPLFLALTLGQSLVYTGLYLRTGGSVLPAILLHATTDLGARLYRIDHFTDSTWMMIDAMILVAGAYLIRSAARQESGRHTSPRALIPSDVRD